MVYPRTCGRKRDWEGVDVNRRETREVVQKKARETSFSRKKEEPAVAFLQELRASKAFLR